MVAWLGPAISAGASLLGGFLNRDAQQSANAASMAFARDQMAQQHHFATHGIRMRVKDAQKAGIHPLFALGASTSSYSPVSVGQTAETGMGDAMARMGQDISRAFHATRTGSERDAAYTDALKAFQLKNLDLDTQIKQATLASAVQRLAANKNPPLPAQGSVTEIAEDKQGEATPLVISNRQIRPARGWSDGQTFEDRWGELGGSAAGLAVMAADILKYGRDWVIRNQGKYMPNLRW